MDLAVRPCLRALPAGAAIDLPTPVCQALSGIRGAAVQPVLIPIDAHKPEALSADPDDVAYGPVAPVDSTAAFFCLGAPVHREAITEPEQAAARALNARE